LYPHAFSEGFETHFYDPGHDRVPFEFERAEGGTLLSEKPVDVLGNGLIEIVRLDLTLKVTPMRHGLLRSPTGEELRDTIVCLC